ncbi:MAG: LolA family protein [Halocynthiibacter sp.]
MIKNILSSALGATLFMGGAAFADKLSIAEIETYLKGLDTAEASFVQINSDSSRSHGVLYLDRPGKARFEYAPPAKAKVVVSQKTVVVFDGRSNQAPEQYPLSKTPLNLVLSKRVKLSGSKQIIGHTYKDGTTRLTLMDPKSPKSGRVELRFADAPAALTSWVITDQYGERTAVELSKMKTGMKLPSRLFDLNAILPKRSLR